MFNLSAIIIAMGWFKIWGCVLVSILAAPIALADQPPPRVWIFAGHPGDKEHHAFFEKNLSSLRETFGTRFGVPARNITVLYGPEDTGYDGTCTREAMLAELEKIVDHGKKKDAAPVWIILHGHANQIPGGAYLNLPGPDLSSTDIALALREFPKETPMFVLAVTAASHHFLRVLSRPGRYIISGSTKKDPDSELDFPIALEAVLKSPESDVDGDGFLSLLELYIGCQQRVVSIYEKAGLLIREHSQLDGDGDGKGSQRPAPRDADPASKVGLKIVNQSNFD